MNSEARRKELKRRWWIKTLLKQRGGPSLLENLIAWKMEVGFEILQE
jgi:hypothetical protein